jgi:hypothetical protein
MHKIRGTSEFQYRLEKIALDYAKQGMFVIPLHTPQSKPGLTECSCGACSSRGYKIGKHPRIRTDASPVSFASSDEATIRKWFEWWPSANIGIVMGRGAGIFGMDFDNRGGGAVGRQEVDALLGDVQTAESVTSQGGRHLYFRHPMVKLGNFNGVWTGVDIRSDDSFLVAPPSLHVTGAEYAWAPGKSPREVGFAEVPQVLLNQILGRIEKMKPYPC